MNKFKLKSLPIAAVCGLAVLSAPAFAGHKSKYRYDDGYDYAEVVDVDPIRRQVRVSVPRQECWDERVVYREPARRGISGGAVLGAILGGVAGHQIGGGHGKDVATAAGAVIGASIGSQHSARRYGEYERVGYEERCRTTEETRYEERIEGYDVTYRYGGRVYHTTMPYDPGDRIPVDVNVRPVRNDY